MEQSGRHSKFGLAGVVLLLSTITLAACGGDGATAPEAMACSPTAIPASGSAAALMPILAETKSSFGLKALIFNATVNGKPVLTTALGDARPGEPATTDMHFRIGMPAEQFAAMLMLRLAEQGRVDPDAPVSNWFPDYPHADRMTVRMLAASSAGVGDYVYGPADPANGIPSFDEVLYSDPRRTFSTSELIERSRAPYQVPQFTNPGANWQYSHTSYAMLGAILEASTGRDYGTLLQEQILTPLALHHTQYAATSAIQAPVLHAFTSERGAYEDATDWSPSWTSFSGRINSNVCDLAVWARAFGTGQLLKPESWAQIAAPTNVGLGPNRPERYFGLGVILNNGWWIGDANFFGWHTATAYYPPKDIALVVTATEGPGTANGNEIAKSLLRKMSHALTPEAPITLP